MSRIDLLQGTLGMLILRALQWGPQHGYGISQAIRTQSSEVLQVETGSLYPALHRLEKQGWVRTEWRQTEANQRAKYLQPDTGRQEAIDRGACALETDGAGHRQHHGYRAGEGAVMRWTQASRSRVGRGNPHPHPHGDRRIACVRERTPKRARAEVMKEFGSVALAMEDTRRVWGGQWLEQLAFDLRYAARSLARTPGFALAAVLSLAIGIGATTALFSVLQHVAWQPLPYRNPGQTGHHLESGSAAGEPAIAGLVSGLAGLARVRARALPAWQCFRNRPGFLRAGERIAAGGTARGLGRFPAAARRCARVGPLLER